MPTCCVQIAAYSICYQINVLPLIFSLLWERICVGMWSIDSFLVCICLFFGREGVFFFCLVKQEQETNNKVPPRGVVTTFYQSMVDEFFCQAIYIYWRLFNVYIMEIKCFSFIQNGEEVFWFEKCIEKLKYHPLHLNMYTYKL